MAWCVRFRVPKEKKESASIIGCGKFPRFLTCGCYHTKCEVASRLNRNSCCDLGTKVRVYSSCCNHEFSEQCWGKKLFDEAFSAAESYFRFLVSCFYKVPHMPNYHKKLIFHLFGVPTEISQRKLTKISSVVAQMFDLNNFRRKRGEWTSVVS